MTDKEGISNPRFHEDRYQKGILNEEGRRMEIKGTGNQEIRKSVDQENREFRNEDFRSFDPSATLRAGSFRSGPAIS